MVRNVAEGQWAARKWLHQGGDMLSFGLLKNYHASLYRTEHGETGGDTGRCEDISSDVMEKERGSIHEGPGHVPPFCCADLRCVALLTIINYSVWFSLSIFIFQ